MYPCKSDSIFVLGSRPWKKVGRKCSFKLCEIFLWLQRLPWLQTLQNFINDLLFRLYVIIFGEYGCKMYKSDIFSDRWRSEFQNTAQKMLKDKKQRFTLVAIDQYIFVALHVIAVSESLKKRNALTNETSIQFQEPLCRWYRHFCKLVRWMSFPLPHARKKSCIFAACVFQYYKKNVFLSTGLLRLGVGFEFW